MKAVMSIGNPIKSDDNVGNVILEKLEVEGMVKIKGEITPENFLRELRDCEEIILLDALNFGGEVGEVKVFNLDEIKEPSVSTHSIPINLLKKFLPHSKIKIIGIQPKNIGFGTKLSEELESKVESIVKKVEFLIHHL